MQKKQNVKKSSRTKQKKEKAGIARSGLSGAFQIIGISFLFGCGLFALVMALEKISTSEVFQVEQIKWVGLEFLEEDEILKGQDAVVGRNIFSVDIEAVHRLLMENPRIKAATVKKDFPNRLLIVVEENQPAAARFEVDEHAEKLTQESVTVVIMDSEAKVLQTGLGSGRDLLAGLPRLLHFKEEAYEKALALGSVLEDRLNLFIDLSNPEDLLVYFTGGEKGQIGLLHFGATHFRERWTRFLAIEEDLKARGLLKWEVDLRFPGQAIVRDGAIGKPFISGKSSDTTYF